MNFRLFIVLAALLTNPPRVASDYIKPFVLASSAKATPAELLQSTRGKLQAAGFEIIGEYQPYPVATVIAITSPELGSMPNALSVVVMVPSCGWH